MYRLFFSLLLMGVVQMVAAQSDSLNTQQLKEAMVQGSRLLLVSKGDTLIYNLDALELEQNATLGQALVLLPGIELREGTLYYKGKKVDRLLVNDFDFAMDDPKRALSQLPTYLLKQVKAYEQRPDKQRRMGYDDGQREVVLNVSVRREYMGVWTGLALAGAGTSERWETRGYVNTFVPRWRLSVFGNANNLGKELWYNGAGREVSGATGEVGRNQYVSPGFTFMYNSGKKEYTPGYWKVDFSGDYNDNRTHQSSRREEETFLEQAHRYTAQRSETRSLEQRWTGHGNFVWTPHEKGTVGYRANVSARRFSTDLHDFSGEWRSNPFAQGIDVLDILQENEEAWPAEKILHRRLARQHSDEERLEFDHLLTANYNFSSRFQIFVRHMLMYSQGQGNDFSLDSYRLYQDVMNPRELLHRYRQRDKSSLFTSSVLEFNWQLGKGVALGMSYDWRTNVENDRTDGFRLDRLIGTPFAEPSGEHAVFGELPSAYYLGWKESTFDETISRKQPLRVLTHRTNVWLRYTWGGNHLSLSFDHPWEYVSMDYTQGRKATQYWQERRRPWRLEATLTQGKDSIGKVYANYRWLKQYPSLLALYRPTDDSQPLRLVMSNPHLLPTYYHSLAVSYSRDIHHSARHRNLIGGLYLLSTTQAYVDGLQQAQAFDRNTAVVTTRPVNVAWQLEQNSSAQYDWPLTANQHWTMQVYLEHQYLYGMGYATTQTLEAAQLLRTHTYYTSFNLRPQYNRKGFRISLAYGGVWLHQQGKHLRQGGLSLFAHTLRLYTIFQLPARFECTAQIKHYGRFGYESEKGKLHQTLVEASLSRVFLRDRSLSLRLSVADLLGQNDGYRPMLTAQSYQRTWHETLGRYVLLSLSWKFSTSKND